MARGRKENLKKGQRYPATGRLFPRQPQERLESIIAVAVSQPHRKWASDPRNANLGSVIGQFFITQQIDARQLRAAERFHSVVLRMKAALSSPPETPGAISLDGSRSGAPLWAADMTEDEQAKRDAANRRDYADAYSALIEAGRAQFGLSRQGVLVKAVRDCVVGDRTVDVGDVRLGLNVLARVWGL